MKKSTKIILGLSVIASMLAVSQIASAFNWRESHGKQKITFEKSSVKECASLTPSSLIFAYTSKSAGKAMTIVKSEDKYDRITQTKRMKPTPSDYGLTYVDLVSGSTSHPAITLKGIVVFISPDDMTNTGTWAVNVNGKTCSSTYSIEPLRNM